MSASEAAFTCCGLAFGAASAALPGLPILPAKGMLVRLVTVWAMARTSSRLKAMGLAAALRFRIESRSAFFLDGFSMGGVEAPAGFAAGF